MAQSLEGLALVYEGRVAEGMRRLNASAVLRSTARASRDLPSLASRFAFASA